MADIWQTIEQAAVTLGLSVRTVNRHITAGKLDSRLFEGRREVRISPSAIFAGAAATDEVSVNTSAIHADRAAPSVAHPSRSHNGNGHNSAMAEAATASDRAEAVSHADDAVHAESSSSDSASFTSANRQRVTADVSAERTMDTNTFLALADSLDDKATLAVAAYQTLARSAESQVQSLRKVALGAWAAVGIMAAGVIIAVGWGTYRLTTAETNSASLREQVQEQKQKIESQAAGRDDEVSRVVAERDAARDELVRTKGELENAKGRAAGLAEAQKTHAAEIAAFVLRQMGATRPTTEPTTHAAAPGTTQPTVTDAATPGATSRPIVKPPTSNGPRPTYLTNSAETFDPK